MYEFPTPNPDPKPTHHWGLDKSPPKKTLNVSVPFRSMQGQKALRFNKKYIFLCSEDECLRGLQRHDGE